MTMVVMHGPWSLVYTAGDFYGYIKHDEFGDVEVIGYDGRPLLLSELGHDLDEWVREQSADYMRNLTRSWS